MPAPGLGPRDGNEQVRRQVAGRLGPGRRLLAESPGRLPGIGAFAGAQRAGQGDHQHQEGGRQQATGHFGSPSRMSSVGLRSEEHTTELQSLMRSSYAVICLTKKNTKGTNEKT